MVAATRNDRNLRFLALLLIKQGALLKVVFIVREKQRMMLLRWTVTLLKVNATAGFFFGDCDARREFNLKVCDLVIFRLQCQ